MDPAGKWGRTGYVESLDGKAPRRVLAPLTEVLVMVMISSQNATPSDGSACTALVRALSIRVRRSCQHGFFRTRALRATRSQP
jgi:hypothetical protein